MPDKTTRYALAFSGGGDSLALLKALAKDRRLAGVLHVDHGLRAESAKESVLATLLGEQLGRKVAVLRWTPGEVETGLQARARQARYGLMGDWCRAHGIRHLVTAHHADDQAETVLMRVERGSGWRGAAGMAPLSYAPVWPELAGVTLVRPALTLSREALQSELGDLWPIQDPSNADAAFTRVQARRRLVANPSLRADMLELADTMSRGREDARLRLAASLERLSLTHEGQATLPSDTPPEHVQAILPAIGGHAGPAELSRTRERLAGLEPCRAVAMGCGVLGEARDGVLTLSRDPVAMTGRRDGTLAPTAVQMAIGPEPRVWDGRFMLSGEGGLINPERRGHHVGFRILYRRDVVVENLVEARLNALIAPRTPPAT